MKTTFLIAVLLISSFLCDAQENNPEKQEIKFYMNGGSTAAFNYKIGGQYGLSIGNDKHIIKVQYMHKFELYLNFDDIGRPNEVEDLKTYSLTYGRSIDSHNKKVTFIPSIGIIAGEEYYRGEVIESYTTGGFIGEFNDNVYIYEYARSKYFGARISIDVLVKFRKYAGFSFEPYLNVYHRSDAGISFNLVIGKFN